MQTILLVLVFTLFALKTHAQQAWSLEKCIEYAIANNIDVAIQDINIELAELGVQQKKHAFGPNINTNIGVNQSFGRSIDFTTYEFTNQSTTSNSYSFSNNIDLFTGLSRLNDLKKSQLEVESTQANRTLTEQNIQLQLLTSFLSVVMAKEQLEQAKKQKENTYHDFERVKALIKAGILAESDAFVFEAQLANNDLSITNFSNNIELGLNDLKLLLRLNISQEFEISVPDLPNPEDLNNVLESADIIYEMALQNRPEIKAAELSEKIREYDHKIAKSGYYPYISFSNTIATNYSNQGIDFTTLEKKEYFKQINDNMAYGLGLSVSIPIFNKNITRIGVQQSIIAINQSKLLTEKTKQDLYRSIVRAYNNAVFSKDNYTASKASENAALKALDSAKSKLNAGLGSNVEYAVANNNYSIAISKLIEAKYNYIFNIKYLDFYKGVPIEL